MYTMVIISKQAMQKMFGKNMVTEDRHKTPITWHQDNKHTDSKLIWIWIQTVWDTDDPYDKNTITADGNNITWSWRYECDGDDGGDVDDSDDSDDSDNGDDGDDSNDRNAMVKIRMGWWW